MRSAPEHGPPARVSIRALAQPLHERDERVQEEARDGGGDFLEWHRACHQTGRQERTRVNDHAAPLLAARRTA
jgi:hypothetical protein